MKQRYCDRCRHKLAYIGEQDCYICQLPKGCGNIIDSFVFYLIDKETDTEQTQTETDAKTHKNTKTDTRTKV